MINIETKYHGNEFIGEIARYCIDGDYIWFYDEISGGLYRLNKKLYTVDVILTPMEIHQKGIFPVRQIVKWKNKVYLIPNNTSHEWLVYDILEKKLKSILIMTQSYEIGNVVNMGEWIYLIPEKTNHILAIIDADLLNVKMIITNWYKKNTIELECWGYSKFEDTISFPIIGTGDIFQIRGDQIIELPFHIKHPIYSISVNKNGIWILPSEGEYIFFIDKNSTFVESVMICTNYYKNMAELFARIIAVDNYLYLLPKQGGMILGFEINSKKWSSIGEKDAPLYRSLYQKTRNLPYWGCYYSEEILYTLPLQYRFSEIDIKNNSINYIILQNATVFMEQQYSSWVYWFSERTKNNLYMEWVRDSLKDFWKCVLKCHIINDEKNIGKNIWRMINKL